MRPLRICVVASSRFPIAEPYAGGLEAHTASLVRALRRRGHEIDLFAAPGTDPALGAHTLPVAAFASSTAARADLAAPPEAWMREHHAYLDLMLHLQREGLRYDLVHNNSLHHLPVAMAGALPVPVVTTLHTPPLPWLESAAAMARGNCSFLAVSHAMRRQWQPVVEAEVVHNGVDARAWPAGDGGPRAVWSGRVVPEKAPHQAVLAARRAGVPLDVVGPAGDPAYLERVLRPLLDDPADPAAAYRYLGHLDHPALRRHIAAAGVAVVTPAWEEPFGLVAVEAMCSGTPVAAYARGALPEIVSAGTGRLAVPDDVDDLARAITEAARLDRAVVRTTAVAAYDVERMVDAYEAHYRRALAGLDRGAACATA